ncbi:hypothetical protein BME81_14000 [Enterobacter hormaechei subsp. steigerwaltii]|nr:hypothetical protein BME81_14000 [Enterobacter hormaechei subsp. steigerwaltii]PAC71866.1 hypothetical protein CGS27_03450 [Enterobacter cloacae]
MNLFRNLNVSLMIMGILPGVHFPLIKIAKSEVGVINLHICLELLFLYMVLTRQENGFQLLRTKFVKA